MDHYPWDLRLRRESEFSGQLSSLASARIGTKYHYVRSKNTWFVLDAYRWNDRIVVDVTYRPSGKLGKLLDFTQKEWDDLKDDGESALGEWRSQRRA